MPYSLARIPKPGETRGNLNAGGIGVAQPLTRRDREIAEALGPALYDEGLMLVGLDVIGDYLTEINVTSPTCMQEIDDQTGFNSAEMMIDTLEKLIAERYAVINLPLKQSFPMTPAIEVRQVHKRFGALHALCDIDLEINTGEFFALLGPNGAGKTTLINIIAGLTLASSGSVRVMGHDVDAKYREARRILGVVPQELVFDPFFTVRETLVFQSGYYGMKKNSSLDRRDNSPS